MVIKFYEDDIKDLILNKKSMFVPEGLESVVIFEKSLATYRGKHTKTVIADCLIFRSDGVVIGIEIKTERDDLSRLRSQLPMYSIVCDYVYVMCHDDHIPKVEKSTQRYKQSHVGIIAYTEFRSIPFLGVYREAEKSPQQSVYSTFNLLWKKEILSILGGFKYHGDRAASEIGHTNYRPVHRGLGMDTGMTQGSSGMSMKKGQLIRNLIARVGEEEAQRMLCDLFINHRMDPARTVKLKHFKPARIREEDLDDE